MYNQNNYYSISVHLYKRFFYHIGCIWLYTCIVICFISSLSNTGGRWMAFFNMNRKSVSRKTIISFLSTIQNTVVHSTISTNLPPMCYWQLPVTIVVRTENDKQMSEPQTSYNYNIVIIRQWSKNEKNITNYCYLLVSKFPYK